MSIFDIKTKFLESDLNWMEAAYIGKWHHVQCMTEAFLDSSLRFELMLCDRKRVGFIPLFSHSDAHF